ncbi:hypothetical protein SISSUDRAFT_1129151 [Sistotremastrum suecicum HHB10207 ss-3]|uniref:Uncharacterized protein n=1 Tax=Sistotremastrum suecicum HHB10207 ss-3 TaxID=1314776 RepID=A0A166CYK5_9AGAM|nr:hypothetical protein SISSUDRAFT_1129151 [Sistotremastrum suecicum HHB10207 ss-3]
MVFLRAHVVKLHTHGHLKDLKITPPPSPTSSPTPPSDGEPANTLKQRLKDALKPFPNYSTFLFARQHWLDGGTNASNRGELKLVKEVLHDPDFHGQDVPANLDRLRQRVIAFNPDQFSSSDGWRSGSVTISIPLGKPKKKEASFPLAVDYAVPGLQSRSIVDTVRRVISSDPNAINFHLHPFREYLHSDQPENPPERIYGELYSSDAFIKEYENVQQLPPEPDCDLERVVLGLQFWSDATLLCQFGDQKLWPMYMFVGNQSKYERSRPEMHAEHDIAYIPTLPDDVQDTIRRHRNGRGGSKPLITHCRRELMHAVLKVLFADPEFRHAYRHGIVLKFPDGEMRRAYLRVITYTGDYPEKVLLATIRQDGFCCCPRCEVEKDEIRLLGTTRDEEIRQEKRRIDTEQRRRLIRKARKLVYEKGYSVNSKKVEDLLRAASLVPTENAFSEALAEYGLDYFAILVVHILHEFEIGEWKGVLTHLIRILYSYDANMVYELDTRYRMVPPFGDYTIRKFRANVSQLKRLAARDYEDLLQVAIPVFKGLFPEPHDTAISRFLFALVDWHSLAKLRLHTTTTLSDLESATRVLGQAFRYFADVTSPGFQTVETPAETEARISRTLKRIQRQTQARSQTQHTQGSNLIDTAVTKRKPVEYTLLRPKLHFLGDYPRTIRLCGTVDSYTSGIGEACHRGRKDLKPRTNNRNIEPQIAKLVTLHEVMRIIAHRVGQVTWLRKIRARNRQQSREIKPNDAIVMRFEIAEDEKVFVRLSQLIEGRGEDPAITDFRVLLLDHIAARVRNTVYELDRLQYDTSDHGDLDIHKNRLYCHKTLRIHYTTYDMRRSTDSIKPFLSISADKISNKNSDRCNIMFRAKDLEQDRLSDDFSYAQVLGAFGFMDPADVIRASHIVPSFHKGRAPVYSQESCCYDVEGDWNGFMVNRYVDRDMMMRYRGGGPGHLDPAQSLARQEYPNPTDHSSNTPITQTPEGLQEEEDQDEDDEEDENEEGSESEDEPEELVDDSDDEMPYDAFAD